ncbi:MAG: dihydropteroate synthase [Balneolaceae bacterium]|nr:dihydropteroate synthase [Balneolaceae bacterium]MDR9407404.1 dihydropteroate synthase [Balneolaceae bacterium]
MEETIGNQSVLSLRESKLSLEQPVVMGILNVTPDSFSDGGRYNSVQRAVDAVGKMAEEGAAIIDIGGESTRPGADPVSESEEINRVIPVLEQVLEAFPKTFFSIDTTKYKVAEKSLELGAHIINDVSGLQKEPRLADLCATYQAGYVLMHSQGDPQTMQKNPQYQNVTEDIYSFMENGIEQLKRAGVSSIMVDPGIGFGKTLQHNLKLIKELKKFITLGYPLLVGASRKSMIGSLLDGRPADERLAGTLAVHYHCLLQGAKILRVHDVQEAVDSVKIFESLKNE